MKTHSLLALAALSLVVACSSDDDMSVGDHGSGGTSGSSGTSGTSGTAGTATAGSGGQSGSSPVAGTSGGGAAGTAGSGAGAAGESACPSPMTIPSELPPSCSTEGQTCPSTALDAPCTAQSYVCQSGHWSYKSSPSSNPNDPTCGAAGNGGTAGSGGASGAGGGAVGTPCTSRLDCGGDGDSVTYACDPHSLTCIEAQCGLVPGTCAQGQACVFYAAACFDACTVSASDPQSTCPTGYRCSPASVFDSSSSSVVEGAACFKVEPVKRDQECKLNTDGVVIPCADAADECTADKASSTHSYCRQSCDVVTGTASCDAGRSCTVFGGCLPASAIDPAPLGGVCKQGETSDFGFSPCGPTKNGIAQGACDFSAVCRPICVTGADSKLTCASGKTCTPFAAGDTIGYCP